MRLNISLALLLLSSTPARAAEPEPYRVGVNSAYLPNLRQETVRRWARESGAAMPRVGMRMDLFQKGMPDHADGWVKDFSSPPAAVLGMLFNESVEVVRDGTKDSGCKPPAGLWEPVFDSGSDEPAAGAKPNPKNEWAGFVAAMAERYDGDGVADAPGSPKVEWFSVWNEPDWVPWPKRPGREGETAMRNWFGRNYAELARLAFVSHRAAKSANPDCRVGMQLCFPESLGLLLDDPKHPLAGNCDFVDFHAYGGKTGDDNCFRNDGIVPVYRSMRAEYEKRKLPLPHFLCSESGVGGGERGSEREMIQAAAVIKANVVGASAGLVTVCWYALVDPSWENMGLIADASKLPPHGEGAVRRRAYLAFQTAAALLPPSTRFVGEVPVGGAAHAYRFRDDLGRDLFVAWADDGKGWGATAQVELPLRPGRWDVLNWYYYDDHKSSEQFTASGGGTRLTVNTMPTFYRLAP